MNNKIKISKKYVIDSFNGIDKIRAKKLYENRFTKKDRLIFSNSLVKCKRILRFYHKRLNEICELEKNIRNIVNTPTFLLNNYNEDKKEILKQIEGYKNFLITFVFKGLDLYFTKEEIREIVGGSKKSLEKYYLENENSSNNLNFTYKYLTKYNTEIFDDSLYYCLVLKEGENGNYTDCD